MGGDLKEEDLVYLGKIVRVRGIKGEVKVIPYSERNSLLGKQGGVFLINRSKIIENFQIKKVIEYKKAYFITFYNIDSMEQAKLLVGSEIAVIRSELPALPSGNFYVFQLVGANVLSSTDNKYIGKVKDVMEGSANDVLIVKKEKDEILVPFSKNIVKKCDLNKNEIIIEPIEGLLD